MQHETIVSLNKDGSGTITETATFRFDDTRDNQEDARKAMERLLAESNQERFHKKNAEKYGKGVTFLKSEEIKPGKKILGGRNIYKFESINHLNLSLTGKATEPESKDRVTFRYQDGLLIVKPPRPARKGHQADQQKLETGDFDPEDPNILGEIGGVGLAAVVTKDTIKGVKSAFRLVFPEGVKTIDATFQKDNTLTLFEIDCDELLKTPKGTGVVKALIQNEAPHDLPEEGKKLPGIKVESERVVVVILQ